MDLNTRQAKRLPASLNTASNMQAAIRVRRTTMSWLGRAMCAAMTPLLPNRTSELRNFT